MSLIKLLLSFLLLGIMFFGVLILLKELIVSFGTIDPSGHGGFLGYSIGMSAVYYTLFTIISIGLYRAFIWHME